MSYFHPKDMDPEQPRIPGLSSLRTFRSYYSLHHCQSKLERWLEDLDFMSLAQADQSVDRSSAPIIEIRGDTAVYDRDGHSRA